MKTNLYLIVAIAYIFLVMVVGILIYKNDKNNKKRKSISQYKQQQNTFPGRIYRVMQRFPLTRGYITKISRRYEMMCPGMPEDIAKKTLSLTSVSFIISIAIMILIYLLQPRIEHFILAAYLIFVINNEVINYYVNRAEIRLRMEQERFISNIGRNFFTTYYIDDAILRAMDYPMSKEMKVHAQALYDITISNNMKEDVEYYNATSQDKFMKMLLSLCVNVIERSSGKERESNMLAANLINLKKEINLDYLKMKKLQFVFSGSVFAAVAVCLPLIPIQSFGLYISPELITFYKGSLGYLYIGFIYLTSVIVYSLTNGAKEVKRPKVRDYRVLERIEKIRIIKAALDNYNEKNYTRVLKMKNFLKNLGENITPNQLLIKSLMIALTTFIVCIAFILLMHSNAKNLLLRNANDVSTLSTAATEEQLSMVQETILFYTDKYKEAIITKEDMVTEVTKENLFRNNLIYQKICDEVVRRVKKYKMEYFKYYELLACIAISGIAFYIPRWFLHYRKKMMNGAMEDEVVQYKSIIYMMMYSEYVTVADLLEQMEIFAVVFKNTIRECLNGYNSGDIEALERMRERETNDSFRHLVSNLIRCDDMPISKAFNEIAADRENYFERRKQEDEFSIQRKADRIKPLAYLPGILVLIYLILPVLVISLRALQDVATLLKETGLY